MSAAQGGALPTVRVSADGARALRHLRPWVWRKDVLEPPAAPGGWVVAVVDPRGQPAGQALWAEKSPLALRLLTRRPPSEDPVDAAWFRSRLQASIARRAAFGREALRLVHGEADGLPGLFVDRYRERLVLQSLSEGMDSRKEGLAATLEELTGATQVVCRDDGSGRDFEQLPRESRVLRGPRETEAEWREGDNVFRTDLLHGMKTGAFLDQAENHLRAGELGRGRALDAFSYHGGFALALSARCESVLALEQDPAAAARLRENVQRNGRRNVEAREANAFDVLHQLDRDGERFDTVVLDPPGLAKRKEGPRTAMRAYRELNVRALRLLRPGGLLVTCSCSGKVKPPDFEEMLLGAADDVRRPIQILERRGPAPDHPALGGLPETEYLKAFFVRPL
ncbi:MAG TPA: class I SAM-dependent rRNA methyltransferase [Myxococcaceae bacterium]|nr:class I SAM-dependent rRNA methyltransferase [Myxococcaceae bacterium]